MNGMTIEERVEALEKEQRSFRIFVNKQLTQVAEALDKANDKIELMQTVMSALNKADGSIAEIVEGLRKQQVTLMDQLELIRKMIK